MQRGLLQPLASIILRELLEILQPNLVTSMESTGIFFPKRDRAWTLNHFFRDHLATV
jgi:hypothetical protein